MNTGFYKKITKKITSTIKIEFYRLNQGQVENIFEKAEMNLLEKYSQGRLKVYILENKMLFVTNGKSGDIFNTESEYKLSLEPMLALSHKRIFLNIDGEKIVYQQIKSEDKALLIEEQNINGFRETGWIYQNDKIIQKDLTSDKFNIFDSVEDLHSYIFWKNHHPFIGLNTYGIEFPLHTEELIEMLALNLGLRRNELNKTESSLVILDKELRSVVLDDMFYINNCLAIIAFFGEILIKEKNASWLMISNYQDKQWLPLLCNEKKEEITRHLDICQMLHPDFNYDISLKYLYFNIKKKT